MAPAFHHTQTASPSLHSDYLSCSPVSATDSQWNELQLFVKEPSNKAQQKAFGNNSQSEAELQSALPALWLPENPPAMVSLPKPIHSLGSSPLYSVPSAWALDHTRPLASAAAARTQSLGMCAGAAGRPLGHPETPSSLEMYRRQRTPQAQQLVLASEESARDGMSSWTTLRDGDLDPEQPGWEEEEAEFLGGGVEEEDVADADGEYQEEWRELMEDMRDVLEELRKEALFAGVRRILSQVQALEVGVDGSQVDEAIFVRALADRLREDGLNAAVCSTSWGYTKGVPAGSHTFLDVLPGDGDQATEALSGRIIVEPNFPSHFDIAAMTPSYRAMWSDLPRVFVGSEASLQGLVELLVEAMRMSLNRHQLPAAPWRRTRYLLAKWTASVSRDEAPSSRQAGPGSRSISSRSGFSGSSSDSGSLYFDSSSRDKVSDSEDRKGPRDFPKPMKSAAEVSAGAPWPVKLGFAPKY